MYDPNASTPLIVPVSCPVTERPEGAPRLWGKLKIKVRTDSLAYRIYQKSEVEETFHCNYELNLDFQEVLEASGLKVSGVSEDGGTRIVELSGHRFFLATGFLPQFTSEEKRSHPLVVAYLEAVLSLQRNAQGN